MTALVVWLAIITYLGFGIVLGRRDVPRFLQTSRDRYPSLYGDSHFDASLRNEAAGWWFLWILFWPVMGAIRLIDSMLTAEIDRIDPVRLQRRIDELERELGMRE